MEPRDGPAYLYLNSHSRREDNKSGRYVQNPEINRLQANRSIYQRTQRSIKSPFEIERLNLRTIRIGLDLSPHCLDFYSYQQA